MFKNFQQLYNYAKNYLGATADQIEEEILPNICDKEFDYELRVTVDTGKVQVMFVCPIDSDEELKKVMDYDLWLEVGYLDRSDLLKIYEDEIFDNNIGNLELFIP